MTKNEIESLHAIFAPLPEDESPEPATPETNPDEEEPGSADHSAIEREGAEVAIVLPVVSPITPMMPGLPGPVGR